MRATISESFHRLREYCEKEHFKGWDPFDGLSSSIFKDIPFLYKNRYIRLGWIQFFKRSPINFRHVTKIQKSYNSKGLALFLTGYCNLYKIKKDERTLEYINFLAKELIALSIKNYSGTCWGYYFDWQARAFFQPANTPTVVATSFSADALFNAYEVTENQNYLNYAISSSEFVLKDLNRTYDEDGSFSFSYSPLDHTQVFNASLLGARLLSRTYSFTKENHLKSEASKAVQFVCKRQQQNGAWAYGNLPFHNWIDSFHTGFNLECIYEYGKYIEDNSFQSHVAKGLRYYLDTFFCEDGSSKYFNNQLYPIDIHAPAQLIVTLAKTDYLLKNKEMAEKILKWTIVNMQDAKGYFYYQKKKWLSSKIPYMRWAQAWMFYSMSFYLYLTEFEESHD